MSKYDEAIKGIEKLDWFLGKIEMSISDITTEKEDEYITSNIYSALNEAQKQEKLLDLYKRLSNLYEKLYTIELSLLSLHSNYYEIEIIKVKQQIKEIENE